MDEDCNKNYHYDMVRGGDEDGDCDDNGDDDDHVSSNGVEEDDTGNNGFGKECE